MRRDAEDEDDELKDEQEEGCDGTSVEENDSYLNSGAGSFESF